MHNFWLSFTDKLAGSRQLLKIVFCIPLLKFRPNFVVQDCPEGDALHKTKKLEFYNPNSTH